MALKCIQQISDKALFERGEAIEITSALLRLGQINLFQEPGCLPHNFS